MTKIVINTCYGGFSLSKEAYEALGIEWDGYGYLSGTDIQRDDPRLVSDEANSLCEHHGLNRGEHVQVCPTYGRWLETDRIRQHGRSLRAPTVMPTTRPYSGF